METFYNNCVVCDRLNRRVKYRIVGFCNVSSGDRKGTWMCVFPHTAFLALQWPSYMLWYIITYCTCTLFQWYNKQLPVLFAPDDEARHFAQSLIWKSRSGHNGYKEWFLTALWVGNLLWLVFSQRFETQHVMFLCVWDNGHSGGVIGLWLSGPYTEYWLYTGSQTADRKEAPSSLSRPNYNAGSTSRGHSRPVGHTSSTNPYEAKYGPERCLTLYWLHKPRRKVSISYFRWIVGGHDET